MESARINSDEQVLSRVSDRLWKDDDIDATEIEVTVENGVVTLSGSVENRQTSRLAELVIAHLPGVEEVRNELAVITQQQLALVRVEGKEKTSDTM